MHAAQAWPPRTLAQQDPVNVEATAANVAGLGELGGIQAACSAGREGEQPRRPIGRRVASPICLHAREPAQAAAKLRALQPPVPPAAHPPADRTPGLSATNLKKATLVPSSVMYTVRRSGITYLRGQAADKEEGVAWPGGGVWQAVWW